MDEDGWETLGRGFTTAVFQSSGTTWVSIERWKREQKIPLNWAAQYFSTLPPMLSGPGLFRTLVLSNTRWTISFLIIKVLSIPASSITICCQAEILSLFISKRVKCSFKLLAKTRDAASSMKSIFFPVLKGAVGHQLYTSPCSP